MCEHRGGKQGAKKIYFLPPDVDTSMTGGKALEKTTVLEQLQTAQAALEAALAPLDETRLVAPGAMGEWSVKDVLAHMATWHLRLLDILEPTEPKRVPIIPMRGLEDGELDEINAQLYAANRSRPLDEVHSAFRSSYGQVEQAVQGLTDDERVNGGRFAWLEGIQLWQIIAGDTFTHYQDHLQAMQEWLRKA